MSELLVAAKKKFYSIVRPAVDGERRRTVALECIALAAMAAVEVLVRIHKEVEKIRIYEGLKE